MGCFLFQVLVCAVTPSLLAHPVPRSTHDRIIRIQIEPTGGSDKVVVRVEYRMEVDEATVAIEDMQPFRDEVDPVNFKGRPVDYYAEYTRIYAPIIAANLVGKLNNVPLQFVCIKRGQSLVDEEGRPLGSLRCDFVFEAEGAVNVSKENTLRIREANYPLQDSKVDIDLAKSENIHVQTLMIADAHAKKRTAAELLPGDEDKLRKLEVVFTPLVPARTETARSPVAPESTPTRKASQPQDLFREKNPLERLILNNETGIVLLLLLAAALGAVHALTPGHGKTLVAAYLVGQRGTVAHAVVLGAVTTITHTGVVLLLAAILGFLYPQGASEESRQTLQAGLGLAMGLTVALLGFYLLLKRLSGGADHIHIGGGHQFMERGAWSVEREGRLAAAAERSEDRVTWWSLIVLGMSGGIIPCWDAIAMLVLAVGMNLFWLALPMLLAFSAGLAGVLVAIGILVVKVRGFAGSLWGQGPIVRALPILSACAVTVIGIWLCYQSVQ